VIRDKIIPDPGTSTQKTEDKQSLKQLAAVEKRVKRVLGKVLNESRTI
jgi:hypothetical protein